jgi:chaperone BCS1
MESGAPGSGKTSTIQALAGELGLDIYVVTLSKRGMDDTTLNTAINAIPSRAMILMEDIDAAFTRSVNREAPVAPAPPIPPMGMGVIVTSDQQAPSSVTLSGLLNAIDGVQAQQGRLLFATTNKYDALDPALVRPGRLDLHIEFTLASKWQASELFKRFYPVEKTPERSTTSLAPTMFADSKATDGTAAPTTILDNVGGETKGKSITMLVEEPDEDLEAVQILTTAPKATQRGRKAPRLSHEELESAAQQFADAIPEQELSMA